MSSKARAADRRLEAARPLDSHAARTDASPTNTVGAVRAADRAKLSTLAMRWSRQADEADDIWRSMGSVSGRVDRIDTSFYGLFSPEQRTFDPREIDGDPPHARTDVNRSAVLAQLGAQGPASRADLARTLGVSPALMTQLTKDLLADGLIVELEHSPSQGGRPARMLGLAASAGRAIGVKVVADHVAFVEVGTRRSGAALRQRAVRRHGHDAAGRPRIAARALHRRRRSDPRARRRRRRPGSRRSPGQRRRRLDTARLEPGTGRRDPAPRPQPAGHRREQRERARDGGTPLRRRTPTRAASSSSRSVPVWAPASWSTGSYFAVRVAAPARSGIRPSSKTARCAAAAIPDASRRSSAKMRSCARLANAV